MQQSFHRQVASPILTDTFRLLASAVFSIGVYIAKDLIPSKQHLDADESIDVEEWEVKDLLEMIYTGKMTDAKTIAAILAYAQKEVIR